MGIYQTLAGGSMNNDDKNNKLVFLIVILLWIVFLIGILAYNPYNKGSKAKTIVATDGKIHYLYTEVISNKTIRIVGGNEIGREIA